VEDTALPLASIKSWFILWFFSVLDISEFLGCEVQGLHGHKILMSFISFIINNPIPG